MTEWKKWEPGDELQDGDHVLIKKKDDGSWDKWWLGDLAYLDENGYGTDCGCGCCSGLVGKVVYWWRPTPPEEPPCEE